MVVVVVMLVAGAMPVRAQTTSVAPSSSSTLRILVLGDSYSAGNGAGDYYGAKGCWRSRQNYAEDYARLIEAIPYDQPAAVTNAACSSATTDWFFHSENARRPELDAVTKRYDLILLTVGGDNIDFAGIVQNCLIQISRDGRKCNALLSAAEAELRNGTLQAKIVDVLNAIRARANSRARIVLLSYPYIEGQEHYLLPYGHGKTIDVPRRLRALEDRGDVVQRRAIAQAQRDARDSSAFVFVSTKRLFACHELYALRLNPKRWFIAPETDAGFAWHDWWYHPNPTGWYEEARLLLDDPAVPKHPASASTHRAVGSRNITLSGVGPLLLGKATEGDVVRFVGTPDAIGNAETPRVVALGYGCDGRQGVALISAGLALCQTGFYFTRKTGRLIEFATDSRSYTALGRIRVGSTTSEAERVANAPAYSGCLQSIQVRRDSSAYPVLNIWIVGGRTGSPSADGTPLHRGKVSAFILDGGADVFDCA
jgi:hypothetical protein